MKAAIFNGPNQPLKIENVDIDDPQDREVRVKVVASGV
jgi:Zn-dependent alcohol dehydrogenase